MKFKVTDNDVFDDNPELRAIPEFVNVPSRSLKYIFFVFDFHSPYKNIPLDSRKELAAKDVGFKMEKDKEGREIRLDKNAREVIGGKNDAVEAATKKFDLLQDNIEQRLIVSYDEQLEEFMLLMRKKDKSDREQALVMTVVKQLPEFLKNRKKILEILNLSKEEVQSEDKDLSDIDQFNQGNY